MQNIELIVARGKTVVHDRKRYGPGQKVTVAKQDADTLIARGFAHREGDAPIVPNVVAMTLQPAGTTPIGRVPDGAATNAVAAQMATRR